MKLHGIRHTFFQLDLSLGALRFERYFLTIRRGAKISLKVANPKKKES